MVGCGNSNAFLRCGGLIADPIGPVGRSNSAGIRSKLLSVCEIQTEVQRYRLVLNGLAEYAQSSRRQFFRSHPGEAMPDWCVGVHLTRINIMHRPR